MNRERDIAKNAFIFTAGRMAAQLAGFLLLPLYSALLTPEDFGIADLINTLVFLIIPFVGIQMDTALFRFTVDCREDSSKQKELFSTVIVINLIQIAVYAAVFFAARPFISLRYKDFLLLNVVLILLVNTFLQFMRGLGKNIMYSAAVFITSFSGLIINVVLIAVVRMGVTGIIISSAASQFLTLVFAFAAVKPWRYFDFGRFSKSTAKTFLKYSFPLIPNQLAWWVMGISDRLVISGAVGIAANGIYSLAQIFVDLYICFRQHQPVVDRIDFSSYQRRRPQRIYLIDDRFAVRTVCVRLFCFSFSHPIRVPADQQGLFRFLSADTHTHDGRFVSGCRRDIQFCAYCA